ncbi:radical SAM protein [Streptomyces oryzae]|uniref:Radical SAM protein n=1 Tax=Streptomyces oryzae TaxID=1434886 RepID=A0ABS3XJV7_9ACTN|nr:radical SAM protein [Streptomyces oryzae]MBO8195595.1 radical SAM protein [Streptomyces oryzae]
MFDHQALRGISSQVPVYVSQDRTLRVKVIDACGMTCTFCHNEGTPVSADNPNRAPDGQFIMTGPSGRTSIYLSTNGARFVCAPVRPDESFRAALTQLQEALDFNEVHFTGGEPTLHPSLPQLVALAKEEGYEVSVTSNGENGKKMLPGCAKAGLDHVNFSIFGTTADELAQVQNKRLSKRPLAERKIKALDASIHQAMMLGLGTRANIVLPNKDHVPRVHRLLTKYAPQLSVRVLSSLEDGDDSLNAIELLLQQLGAEPEEVHVIAGTSGFRVSYRLSEERRLMVKHIRSLRLPRTCASCRFNNSQDCQEGYYGVRLYRDPKGIFHVGVCIQRMDLCLPVDEFVNGPLCDEIREVRERDRRDLAA